MTRTGTCGHTATRSPHLQHARDVMVTGSDRSECILCACAESQEGCDMGLCVHQAQCVCVWCVILCV